MSCWALACSNACKIFAFVGYSNLISCTFMEKTFNEVYVRLVLDRTAIYDSLGG